MSDKNALWEHKYRPHTLDEYIFHDENQKTSITKMVEELSIPHLLLSGVQGSGKTSLALILIDILNVDPLDILLINGSDETGVDTTRDKVKSFISTYGVGEFKIVYIEEADRLSPHAQDSLKHMMDDSHNSVRFIFTCNHPNRIIPPIKSRTQEFKFQKHDVDDITEMMAGILIKEKIKFDLKLLDEYVRVAYPDVRKIINLLQQHSKSGVLLKLKDADGSGEYKIALLDYLQKDDWQGARQLLCAQVSESDEWEEVYKFLYENLSQTKKFSSPNNWEAGILAIAEHLYKHALMSDPEINAAALFIRLGQIGENNGRK